MLEQLRAQAMQKIKDEVSCKLRRDNTNFHLNLPTLPQQDQSFKTMQLGGAGCLTEYYLW